MRQQQDSQRHNKVADAAAEGAGVGGFIKVEAAAAGELSFGSFHSQSSSSAVCRAVLAFCPEMPCLSLGTLEPRIII